MKLEMLWRLWPLIILHTLKIFIAEHNNIKAPFFLLLPLTCIKEEMCKDTFYCIYYESRLILDIRNGECHDLKGPFQVSETLPQRMYPYRVPQCYICSLTVI